MKVSYLEVICRLMMVKVVRDIISVTIVWECLGDMLHWDW